MLFMNEVFNARLKLLSLDLLKNEKVNLYILGKQLNQCFKIPNVSMGARVTL